ncbi:hypothetical protein [Anaerophilus nitritogenes]|uniref:hypothetical protein n=1 Tax=Anaerophilus nitritogenes TaxID=2498136 RepID=UPI00101CBE27|nr:hypothetical protein [Anaerophilus nitritogenes]
MRKRCFLVFLSLILFFNCYAFSFGMERNKGYPCFINNKLIYLNENEKPFKLISKMDPKKDKTIVMFSIKRFYENLGFNVLWIKEERKIVVSKDHKKIEFFIDEKDENKMVRMDNHYVPLYFRTDLKGKNITIKNGVAFTDLDFLIDWLDGTGSYIEEKDNILTDGSFSLPISQGSLVYEHRDIISIFGDSYKQPFKTSYKPKGMDHLSIFYQSFPSKNPDTKDYEPKDLYGNAPSIYINDQLLFIQRNEVPYIKESIHDPVIMVPLQRILEYVGCNFQFDKNNQIITLSKGEDMVQIFLPEKKSINIIGAFNISNTNNIEIDVRDDLIFIDFDFLIYFLNGIYYYWKIPSNKIESYISF